MGIWLRSQMANLITSIGIILTFWLNFIIWSDGPIDFFLILVLSISIALSDLFDGMIARYLKIQSQIGASLDRLRDKFFACSIFLYFFKRIWFWNCGLVWTYLIKSLIILLLIIEVTLLISWIYGFIKRINIQSHLAGKIKMTIYFIVIGWYFLFAWLGKVLNEDFRMLICCGVIILMFIAGIYGILSVTGYLERFYQEIQNRA